MSISKILNSLEKSWERDDILFNIKKGLGTDEIVNEFIEKNEIVKKAFENIKLICIDLQKQTNCPEEDLKDFLEFISKQWNK